MNTQWKLKELRRTISNDLAGLLVEESDWGEGYILRDPKSGRALYTVYVSPNGYSAYVCIGNAMTGDDIEDEEALCENVVSHFTPVARIKAHQIATGQSSLYPKPKELWQGATEELCGFWN